MDQSKASQDLPSRGVGRPKGEPSKVIRLPVRLLPAVQALAGLPAGALLPSPLPSSLKLPLFGHKVRAGFPSPADDYVEAWLDLNEHLIEHKEATFFVQATGDSMIGAGIQEGTLLVVDRALEAHHNDIVIAVVDGELTVKRLEKRRGRIRLIAENPAYAPIEFKEGQELVVWGVVTSIIQKLK
jgi:SOS-response transcriptional repressors (RecA-mediated autopeptidases)